MAWPNRRDPERIDALAAEIDALRTLIPCRVTQDAAHRVAESFRYTARELRDMASSA